MTLSSYTHHGKQSLLPHYHSYPPLVLVRGKWFIQLRQHGSVTLIFSFPHREQPISNFLCEWQQPASQESITHFLWHTLRPWAFHAGSKPDLTLHLSVTLGTAEHDTHSELSMPNCRKNHISCCVSSQLLHQWTWRVFFCIDRCVQERGSFSSAWNRHGLGVNTMCAHSYRGQATTQLHPSKAESLIFLHLNTPNNLQSVHWHGLWFISANYNCPLPPPPPPPPPHLPLPYPTPDIAVYIYHLAIHMNYLKVTHFFKESRHGIRHATQK